MKITVQRLINHTYKLAGEIGYKAEVENSRELETAYNQISNLLDYLEKLRENERSTAQQATLNDINKY